LYYGYDQETWNIDLEYLMGTDFLVAPCMDESTNTTKVYFPHHSGRWQYLVSELLSHVI
jgi:alpha-glucosidase (family GH31 glycosyl hydrolase)